MGIALVLLVLPDPYREGIAAGIRGTVLRPVIALQRGAVDREGRFMDASVIRAERDSLAAYLVDRASLAAENRELRALLGMRPRLPYGFVPAEVLRLRGPVSEGAFLLTAGREQGVRPGAPIVTAQGLVGTIRNVDESSAIGIDWTHPDFRASAVALDGETYGIVEPRTGPRGERLLALNATALHTVPDSGTVIVTSGAGGYYPRGIPIGTVVGEADDAGTWQKTYLIDPFVTPAEMSHVLVLGERREEEAERELAAAWGIRLSEAAVPDTVVATPTAPPAREGAQGEGAAQPAPRRPRPRGIVRPEEPEGPPLLGEPVRPPREREEER